LTPLDDGVVDPPVADDTPDGTVVIEDRTPPDVVTLAGVEGDAAAGEVTAMVEPATVDVDIDPPVHFPLTKLNPALHSSHVLGVA